MRISDLGVFAPSRLRVEIGGAEMQATCRQKRVAVEQTNGLLHCVFGDLWLASADRCGFER